MELRFDPAAGLRFEAAADLRFEATVGVGLTVFVLVEIEKSLLRR